MKDWQSQAHVKWECKYHLVFVPKYLHKVLYGKIRKRVGEILRKLCQQRGIYLLECKATPDHIHMLLSVPPKYRIAHTVGYLKGKSAIRIHRNVLKTKGILFGRSFWSRGYCVSTVGWDEEGIRNHYNSLCIPFFASHRRLLLRWHDPHQCPPQAPGGDNSWSA
jgi:putative transposase